LRRYEHIVHLQRKHQSYGIAASGTVTTMMTMPSFELELRVDVLSMVNKEIVVLYLARGRDKPIGLVQKFKFVFKRDL
jgi:hypothetical protein